MTHQLEQNRFLLSNDLLPMIIPNEISHVIDKPSQIPLEFPSQQLIITPSSNSNYPNTKIPLGEQEQITNHQLLRHLNSPQPLPATIPPMTPPLHLKVSELIREYSSSAVAQASSSSSQASSSVSHSPPRNSHQNFTYTYASPNLNHRNQSPQMNGQNTLVQMHSHSNQQPHEVYQQEQEEDSNSQNDNAQSTGLCAFPQKSEMFSQQCEPVKEEESDRNSMSDVAECGIASEMSSSSSSLSNTCEFIYDDDNSSDSCIEDRINEFRSANANESITIDNMTIKIATINRDMGSAVFNSNAKSESNINNNPSPGIVRVSTPGFLTKKFHRKDTAHSTSSKTYSQPHVDMSNNSVTNIDNNIIINDEDKEIDVGNKKQQEQDILKQSFFSLANSQDSQTQKQQQSFHKLSSSLFDRHPSPSTSNQPPMNSEHNEIHDVLINMNVQQISHPKILLSSESLHSNSSFGNQIENQVAINCNSQAKNIAIFKGENDIDSHTQEPQIAINIFEAPESPQEQESPTFFPISPSIQKSGIQISPNQPNMNFNLNDNLQKQSHDQFKEINLQSSQKFQTSHQNSSSHIQSTQILPEPTFISSKQQQQQQQSLNQIDFIPDRMRESIRQRSSSRRNSKHQNIKLASEQSQFLQQQQLISPSASVFLHIHTEEPQNKRAITSSSSSFTYTSHPLHFINLQKQSSSSTTATTTAMMSNINVTPLTSSATAGASSNKVIGGIPTMLTTSPNLRIDKSSISPSRRVGSSSDHPRNRKNNNNMHQITQSQQHNLTYQQHFNSFLKKNSSGSASAMTATALFPASSLTNAILSNKHQNTTSNTSNQNCVNNIAVNRGKVRSSNGKQFGGGTSIGNTRMSQSQQITDELVRGNSNLNKNVNNSSMCAQQQQYQQKITIDELNPSRNHSSSHNSNSNNNNNNNNNSSLHQLTICGTSRSNLPSFVSSQANTLNTTAGTGGASSAKEGSLKIPVFMRSSSKHSSTAMGSHQNQYYLSSESTDVQQQQNLTLPSTRSHIQKVRSLSQKQPSTSQSSQNTNGNSIMTISPKTTKESSKRTTQYSNPFRARIATTTTESSHSNNHHHHPNHNHHHHHLIHHLNNMNSRAGITTATSASATEISDLPFKMHPQQYTEELLNQHTQLAMLTTFESQQETRRYSMNFSNLSNHKPSANPSPYQSQPSQQQQLFIGIGETSQTPNKRSSVEYSNSKAANAIFTTHSYSNQVQQQVNNNSQSQCRTRSKELPNISQQPSKLLEKFKRTALIYLKGSHLKPSGNSHTTAVTGAAAVPGMLVTAATTTSTTNAFPAPASTSSSSALLVNATAGVSPHSKNKTQYSEGSDAIGNSNNKPQRIQHQKVNANVTSNNNNSELIQQQLQEQHLLSSRYFHAETQKSLHTLASVNQLDNQINQETQQLLGGTQYMHSSQKGNQSMQQTSTQTQSQQSSRQSQLQQQQQQQQFQQQSKSVCLSNRQGRKPDRYLNTYARGSDASVVSMNRNASHDQSQYQNSASSASVLSVSNAIASSAVIATGVRSRSNVSWKQSQNYSQKSHKQQQLQPSQQKSKQSVHSTQRERGGSNEGNNSSLIINTPQAQQKTIDRLNISMQQYNGVISAASVGVRTVSELRARNFQTRH